MMTTPDGEHIKLREFPTDEGVVQINDGVPKYNS